MKKYLVWLISCIHVKFSLRRISIGPFTRTFGNKLFVDRLSRIRLGRNVRLAGRCRLEARNGSCLVIEEGTSLNYSCQIYGDVHIGRYTTLASEVYISSWNHNISSGVPMKIADSISPLPSSPVYIGEDVWLGKGSIISPGVYIAKGVVIGSNAIVTKSIYHPYSIIIGANQVLRQRFTYGKPENLRISLESLPYFLQGIRVLNVDDNIRYYSNNFHLIVAEFTEIEIRGIDDFTISSTQKNVRICHKGLPLKVNPIIERNLIEIAEKNTMVILEFSFQKETILDNLLFIINYE